MRALTPIKNMQEAIIAVSILCILFILSDFFDKIVHPHFSVSICCLGTPNSVMTIFCVLSTSSFGPHA